MNWPSLVGVVVSFAFLFGHVIAQEQQASSSMAKTYRDERNCLITSELRGAADRPISSSCRDALVDLRSFYQTTSATGTDPSPSGGYSGLIDRASQKCGDTPGTIMKAARDDWRWNGPEVVRRYPPDASIELIKPDGEGFRSVAYEVRLTHHDTKGRVTHRESYRASDKVAPDFRNPACSPAAICLKGKP